MEIDPTRMCRLLVGLPAINVIGVVDWTPSVPLVVHIESWAEAVERCQSCGAAARVKDHDRLRLVHMDLRRLVGIGISVGNGT